MGFLKKLHVRNKIKSTWDLTDGTSAKPFAHQVEVPKQEAKPASLTYTPPPPPPPPPPYELEPELRDEYTDTGSILIGIDFGTTYSGVAWAYSKQPDEINIITNWDSTEYEASDKGKAPTKISYRPTIQNGGDYSSQHTWGYGVGDDEAIEWFKLLLLDDSDMNDKQVNSPQIKKAKDLLKRANKTPVQAVADYLRLLWAHAISNIEKAFGEEALEGLPYEVVCTVPAVWTTKAVNKMREAAKIAGILERRLAGETTLRFVSEPEAAALATFEDLKNRPNFQVGDSFVVCDAGGGTVDLISYKMTQVKPMQLVECVEGSGSLCGAVFLDQDFESLMQQWIGDAWNVPDSVIKTFMNTQWENGIKRGFDGKDRNWKITLPYECTMRGAPYRIDLSQGHVQEIFDNVVSQVRVLVNDQITAIEAKEGRLPKAIVLVGGFGSCRYLYNLLNMENKHRGIEVYQSTGNKPWTAICRGAVLKALTNSSLPGPIVQTRISRCNYGTRYHTDFNPAKHLDCDRFINRVSGRPEARNQLKWYLKRGDDIDEAKPVRLLWNINVSAEQFRNAYPLSVNIFTCDDKEPPSRHTSSVRQGSEINSKDHIDIAKLKPFKGTDGKLYKRIDFAIEMTVIGTALDFALVYKGDKIGHSQVEPELDNGY